MHREQIKSRLAVYLVMGLEGNGNLSSLDIAREALDGGVTLFQLREKKAQLKEVLRHGQQLRDLCREYGVPFLVNDRVDVALLLDADGVHVGQDDIPGLEARKLLGPDKIVGISAGTMEEAEWAVAQGADYLGVGPVYATSTKKDAGDAIGTDLIRRISERWPSIPLVGIGGIQHNNAVDVIQAGAAGVAVVSAITHSSDPREAASLLHEKVFQITKNTNSFHK